MENTTTKTPRFNYTQNAWEGRGYDSSLSYKEIAKLVRQELKEKFPECKFSVTKESYSGGGSISIALMEAPFNPFSQLTDEIRDKIENNTRRSFGNNWESIMEQSIQNFITTTTERKHYEINHFYIDDAFYLTEQTREIMTLALGILQKYNFDDSDAMIDYFHTNFYVNIGIGKWDKPFLQTNQK